MSIAMVAVLVGSVLATGGEVAHAATAPSAPTAVNVVAGDGRATISWSAPASNGGAAITAYVVTPWVGYFQMPSRTFASTATTQVLTGLTRTWSYRFAVSAVNATGTSAASALSNAVVPVAPSTASPTAFVHPGVLVSKADLDFVRAQVAAGREPWKSALNNTLASYSSESTARRPTRYRYSSLSYPPAPVAVVQAGGNEGYLAAHPELGGNVGGVEHLDDAQAAYTHALLWYYTGNPAYATKAKEILNAWSLTLQEI
ncbi:MAG: fibronectin type III domain-containing protein, partial [Acidimicrobiales bacterium]